MDLTKEGGKRGKEMEQETRRDFFKTCRTEHLRSGELHLHHQSTSPSATPPPPNSDSICSSVFSFRLGHQLVHEHHGHRRDSRERARDGHGAADGQKRHGTPISGHGDTPKLYTFQELTVAKQDMVERREDRAGKHVSAAAAAAAANTDATAVF
ncbi:hypothetical protein SEVIR_3G015450v4 [Setaria viridis]